MIKQSGYTLTELLISLLLASLISTAMMQIYFMNKRQYDVMQKQLEEGLDLQWIEELLSNSIRHAGFTPCMSVEQLKTIDRRDFYSTVHAIQITQQHRLKINRMNEIFAQVADIRNGNQIFITEQLTLIPDRPVILADCEHAEIQLIQSIDKTTAGMRITLTKPLIFSYNQASIGEWIEERWFIKPNRLKQPSLYYQALVSDELSPLIDSFTVTTLPSRSKQLFKINLRRDASQIQPFVVVARNT